jgi:hypothetical protein
MRVVLNSGSFSNAVSHSRTTASSSVTRASSTRPSSSREIEWRRVRLSYCTVVVTTADAMVRSTHTGTLRRSSTV